MAVESSATTKPFTLPLPVSLDSWLSLNASALKPPVSNRNIFNGSDFILQAVAGPNTRCDYHVNETEEWFYQLKGKVILKVVEVGNQFRDIEINEGEMFLLPGKTPHCPVRGPGTLGLVMERQRTSKNVDRLRWYCPNTSAHQDAPHIIREESFFCENIEQNLKIIIEDWQQNEKSRTCQVCGVIAPQH